MASGAATPQRQADRRGPAARGARGRQRRAGPDLPAGTARRPGARRRAAARVDRGGRGAVGSRRPRRDARRRCGRADRAQRRPSLRPADRSAGAAPWRADAPAAGAGRHADPSSGGRGGGVALGVPRRLRSARRPARVRHTGHGGVPSAADGRDAGARRRPSRRTDREPRERPAGPARHRGGADGPGRPAHVRAGTQPARLRGHPDQDRRPRRAARPLGCRARRTTRRPRRRDRRGRRAARELVGEHASDRAGPVHPQPVLGTYGPGRRGDGGEPTVGQRAAADPTRCDGPVRLGPGGTAGLARGRDRVDPARRRRQGRPCGGGGHRGVRPPPASGRGAR